MTKIIYAFCFIGLFTSCRYSDDLGELKELQKVNSNILMDDQFELTQENQSRIESYFQFPKEVSYKFETNSSFQNYFHRKFFRYYSTDFCESLVSKFDYDLLLKKCTVNTFFICADDVVYFEQYLSHLYSVLSDQEKQKILEDKNCSDKLSEYGLN